MVLFRPSNSGALLLKCPWFCLILKKKNIITFDSKKNNKKKMGIERHGKHSRTTREREKTVVFFLLRGPKAFAPISATVDTSHLSHPVRVQAIRWLHFVSFGSVYFALFFFFFFLSLSLSCLELLHNATAIVVSPKTFQHFLLFFLSDTMAWPLININLNFGEIENKKRQFFVQKKTLR